MVRTWAFTAVNRDLIPGQGSQFDPSCAAKKIKMLNKKTGLKRQQCSHLVDQRHLVGVIAAPPGCQLLTLLIFAMVSFVSFAFISALIFKISFLLLTLGFFISSFSSCFRCRVRLFDFFLVS